jgi:two-component system cell cycle sensor histidine kinase/response regulator CckA
MANGTFDQEAKNMKGRFVRRPSLLLIAVIALSFMVSMAGYAWYGLSSPLFMLYLVVFGSLSGVAYFAYRTACRQTHEALSRQHDYYRGILESRHESVIVIDRDFRIRELNENYLKTTGKSRDEVIGQPCYRVSRGRTRPCGEDGDHQCPAAYVFKTGKHQSIVQRHFRPGGEPFDVEVSASPLQEENGKISLVVETMRDITELNHLKALFLQAQKMEAVGRLAGGMAHDFNNLMNVVIGYSEMLLHKAASDDPGRQGLESILDAGERAATLTRQLLAFSRKQIIEPKILDMSAVITDMERILRRIIGEDIELISKGTPGIGRVRADLGMIEQVIMNLAVNARDAMPDGGKLTIETANVEFDEHYVQTHQGSRPGSYVMLAISDTGMGMTPEVKARIFEPFFTTKEMGKGTGLGLSTVFGIVKQHNGYIMAYSEPGNGASFKIYLPRVEEELESEGRKVPQRATGGKETILIVEDDEGLRTMAGMMLEDLGYTVLSCPSGEEALARLTAYEGGVELLFTDVVMPGMNGKSLAEEVRSLRPEVKVLYTSGYPDNDIEHRGVLDPAALFIQKPFTSAALGAKIRKALNT